VITMRDYVRRGEADVLAELHDAMKGRPVYLSWDMDSFDPSVAPGVCTPTGGGFTAREELQLLRGLAGLDIVAVDINIVSPPHDVNGKRRISLPMWLSRRCSCWNTAQFAVPTKSVPKRRI
jgi:agmatinase